jgi:hypothetical protein
VAFALAGYPRSGFFWNPAAGGRSITGSFGLYIAALFAAGLVGGVIGAAIGHICASIWERLDLRLHPRSYEDRPGGA